MAVSRKRSRKKPTPLLGSQAFGHHPDGVPTGSRAVGGSDPRHPLRGALLFGNDPTGSRAVGGSDASTPLRGGIRKDPGEGDQALVAPQAARPPSP